MLALLLLVAWLVVTGLIFWRYARWRKDRRARGLAVSTLTAERPSSGEAQGDGARGDACLSHGGFCCGLHEVCEKGLPRRDDPSLYFDDEELDRFAHRPPEAYAPEEVAEIRAVLESVLPDELAEWARCLGRRHIQLPSELRAELLGRMRRC